MHSCAAQPSSRVSVTLGSTPRAACSTASAIIAAVSASWRAAASTIALTIVFADSARSDSAVAHAIAAHAANTIGARCVSLDCAMAHASACSRSFHHVSPAG